METQIKVFEKARLKNPVLVEGLPGIGNVGRVAAGYLVNELKMKKFAELYSPHFLPLVILQNDSIASLLKCEFYYGRAGGRNIIVLTGDTQSISPEGHYDVCDKILDFAKSFSLEITLFSLLNPRIKTVSGFDSQFKGLPCWLTREFKTFKETLCMLLNVFSSRTFS